jgi:hypothetical protein
MIFEASSGYCEPVRNIPNLRSRSQDPELATNFEILVVQINP